MKPWEITKAELFKHYDDFCENYQKVISNDCGYERIKYNYPFFEETVEWHLDPMKIMQITSSDEVERLIPCELKGDGPGISRASFDLWLHKKLVEWALKNNIDVPNRVLNFYPDLKEKYG